MISYRGLSLYFMLSLMFVVAIAARPLACNYDEFREYEVGFFFPELDILLDPDASAKRAIANVSLECDSSADEIVKIALAFRELFSARTTQDICTILADTCSKCESYVEQSLDRGASQNSEMSSTNTTIPSIKLLVGDSKMLILNWDGAGALAISTSSRERAILVVQALFSELYLHSSNLDFYQLTRCSQQSSADFFAVQDLSSEKRTTGIFVFEPSHHSTEYLVIIRQLPSVSRFFSGISTFSRKSDKAKLLSYWQLESQK